LKKLSFPLGSKLSGFNLFLPDRGRTTISEEEEEEEATFFFLSTIIFFFSTIFFSFVEQCFSSWCRKRFEKRLVQQRSSPFSSSSNHIDQGKILRGTHATTAKLKILLSV
jgi:hypothetical protein